MILERFESARAKEFDLTHIECKKAFGGYLNRYSHLSLDCFSAMTFSVYLPPQISQGAKDVPALYWLSGYDCNDDYARVRTGAHKFAAEHGIAIVYPDTSPRGQGISDEKDRYDLGQGAGFYVNATQSPWQLNYQMYEYITKELPNLIEEFLPIRPDVKSISGHSMGGHGALICALKEPTKYKSVSAFAPICNPSKSSWGEVCFSAYLGEDRETWKAYDATELVNMGAKTSNLLIDQGTADIFYEKEKLLPENLKKACDTTGQPITIRYQDGYDHSYHFVSTFIAEHIEFHAKALNTKD